LNASKLANHQLPSAVQFYFIGFETIPSGFHPVTFTPLLADGHWQKAAIKNHAEMNH